MTAEMPPIHEFPANRKLHFAEYTRFALSGNALNPTVDNLPKVQSAELNHLDDTVNKIAGATTLARYQHWQRIAPKNAGETDEQQHARQLTMWKDSLVAGMKKKGNKKYVDALSAAKFAGIDYRNFTVDTAQALYDRYKSKAGPDGMQDVVMNGEKMVLQENLALFLKDVATTYEGNQLAINADIDAILWLAGVFDIPTEANGQPTFTTLINRCLETNYYLQPNNIRVLTEEANKTIKDEDKEMLRINWLGGGDWAEKKELEFLWGKVEGLQQKKVKVKETDPVRSAVNDELQRISIDKQPDPSLSPAENIADYFSKDFNDVPFALLLSPEAFKETYRTEKPTETDPERQKDTIRNIIATNIAKRIINDPEKKNVTDTLAQQIADALQKKETKDSKKIYADHPEKYGEPGFRHVGSEQSRTYQKKGGWKLNLTVAPEKYAKVDEWLDKNYPGQYKLLSGGDPGQNDFTIYVGSKDESNEWAEKIKAELGDDLLDNNSGSTYRAFNDKVRGRFDIQATGQGSWYYGYDGIPYDKEAKDAEYQVNYAERTNNATHKETWEAILAQHQKRIEKELTEKYPEYFTGKPYFKVLYIRKPETPAELNKIISENVDKPLVIEAEDLQPQDLNIELVSAFDRLGNRDTFQRKNQLDENTAVTDLIPLPGLTLPEGQLYYFNISKKRDNGTVYYSSSLVLKDKNGTITPVGHADYVTPTETPKEATASFGILDKIVQDTSYDQMPTHVKTVNDYFFPPGTSDVAVHVRDEFKGKNLGKYLWYLSLAQAELDSISEIKILGDLTAGQRPDKPAESFYKHLGAQFALYMGPVTDFTTHTIRSEVKEKLYSPTFLSNEQVDSLRKLFNNKDDIPSGSH